MGRRRGLRVRKGLPRGGLGRVGWLPCLAALATAFLVRADVAAVVGALALPLCVWCALGLRRDDQAGEVSDYYIDDHAVEWGELLWGNIVYKERRHSNTILVICLLGCLVAWCRWWFGWGPVV